MNNKGPFAEFRTEGEWVAGLCQDRYTLMELTAECGGTPRETSIRNQSNAYLAGKRDPAVYWQERIHRLELQIVNLEVKRDSREPPPIPYIF